jgi:hypothetical protein
MNTNNTTCKRKRDTGDQQRPRKKRKTHDEPLRDDLCQDIQHFCKENKLLKMIFPKQWEPLYLFLRKFRRDIVVNDESLAQLLKTSLICIPPDAPSPPNNNTFEQTGTQSDIVDRVISSLLQNSKKSAIAKHVLTFGYGTVRYLAN